MYVLVAALLMLCGPAAASDDKNEFIFGNDPAVSSIAPQKEVTVKLKRLKDGTYTWEITGDNVDEILRIDKLLRRKLDTKK